MAESLSDMESFMAGAWSLPLRRLCPHLSAQVRERVDAHVPIPRWAQPEYLLWLVAEAISERAAWQATQPGEPRYRFGRLSEPCWEAALRQPYTVQYRHGPDAGGLLNHLSLELECLSRVTQAVPSEVRMTLWVLTLVETYRRLGRLFGKLKRRYKAARAREVLRQALHIFLAWHAGEAA